jgi:glycosyltransferase involved in cell wall biosynthesis
VLIDDAPRESMSSGATAEFSITHQMASPIVSIGMPVFNGADYIHRSLGSLLAQDYDDFEIIISDNASTDQTEEICRQFVREDNRIRYVRNQTNLGAARNYNNVFHLARGRFFKWAAHDDECHPAMIRRCVETLDNAPPFVVMVYPLAELIDGQGARVCAPLDHIEVKDPRPHRRLGRLLWSLSMCDPVFGVIKSEYLRQTQLIGPFFGADYVLLAELAMLGQIWEHNEILFRLRAHPKRSMQANANSRTRTAWYCRVGNKWCWNC